MSAPMDMQMDTANGDGRLFKMEVDYKEQVDAAIEKANDIAKSTGAEAAVESLVELEKLTRLGADMRSNTRVCQHMVKLAFDGAKWSLLNQTITTLAGKRLLIKVAIASMVRDCCAMVDKTPNAETRRQLIETLRTVTAGKIYVEVERARLTQLVVKQLEEEGKIDEAANMLLDLQVETYGSMEMTEKVTFLLEQMRFCIQRKDFVRAGIVGRKVSSRFFDTCDNEEVTNLRLRYYEQLVEVAQANSDWAAVCRYLLSIHATPSVVNNLELGKDVLKKAVLYALLAESSPEQWTLVHTLKGIRQLDLTPDYKRLLELFIVQEIINWKKVIEVQYTPLLRQGNAGCPATDVFDPNTEAGNKRWAEFHTRVSQHNLRCIAKYYTQISLDRLAELLDMDAEKTEKFVCNAITEASTPHARIDRLSRNVTLLSRPTGGDRLDEWASNVASLTDTINKVTHLIQKEQMVHRHLDLRRAP